MGVRSTMGVGSLPLSTSGRILIFGQPCSLKVRRQSHETLLTWPRAPKMIAAIKDLVLEYDNRLPQSVVLDVGHEFSEGVTLD
jgi:hypothetical protein